MKLINSRTKGLSILSQLRFVEPLSEEASSILVERLKLGDKSAVDQLIKGYMRMAVSIASKYAVKVPCLTDDIISESLLGLTVAVNKAATRLLVNKSIAPYIAGSCHNSITHFLAKNRTMLHLSKVSAWRRRKRGLQTLDKIVISMSDNTTFTHENGDITEISYGVLIPDKKQQNRIVDLLDTLNICIESELEAQVITLRRHGYKDPEIAEKLKISVMDVWTSRNNVRKRFQQRQ